MTALTKPEIYSFEREDYALKCRELKKLLTEEKELKLKKDKLKEEVIEMAGGDRMEYGIKVQYREVKGSIDWEKLARHFLDDSKINGIKDEFRKETKCYWDTRSY